MIAQLAIKSLRNRKFTAALTAFSIALSVMLLLGVERIRHESRASFTATISGTDLIVGARSSPVHLLLYSVFHVGNPTNNLRWESYQAIARRPEVAWTLPLSLGDTHKGYRVLGTTTSFFEHFRYGAKRSLALERGHAFANEREAVLGAEVARHLRYAVGDAIVLAHGAGDVSFTTHDDHPFRVSGVLSRTGTPVDRSVHVSLEALEAMHAAGGSDDDPLAVAAHHTEARGAPVSAFLVGLKSRSAALSVQRFINEYQAEPLTAILPGATLQEVWEILGTVERTLFAVSVLVVIVGLAGMLVALLTSLNERRREMAVLRAVGARPAHVFALILGEAAFLTLSGIVAGVAALQGGLALGRGWLESQFGLFIEMNWPSPHELGLLVLVAAAGVLTGFIPAYRIYRRSLSDGMTIRI